MSDTDVVRCLSRLADSASSEILTKMGFEWTQVDRAACASACFQRSAPDAPTLVGLVGGASSGKSTVFNSLVGEQVSRVSAHAHETLGAVAAVHRSNAERIVSWIERGTLFSKHEAVVLDGANRSTGRVGAVEIHAHDADTLRDVVIVDLPDVTSSSSAEEGSVTTTLLPWFDGVVVVVDEERWFDATVFDDTVRSLANFGSNVWLLFNRTDNGDALSDVDTRTLAKQAEACRASGWCVSGYMSGAGFRPVSNDVTAALVSWMDGVDPAARSPVLDRYLERRCSAVLRDNVARSRQYDELRRAVDSLFESQCAEARLTVDLLTNDERKLLGVGHRFVPLYTAFETLRRFMRRGRPGGGANVEFDKRTEQLADVLRRNLDHRFHTIADEMNRLVQDSDYLSGGPTDWEGVWEAPAIDPDEWAARIRAHIDAWKAERQKQSRRGDRTIMAVGTPLLLADLLFLGGAGVTWLSATAWLAGMLGGKGVLEMIQRSEAFAAYQTSVRAYERLVREALRTQAERNLATVPKRHLAMTDPTLEAVMSVSTPREARR